MLKYTIKRLVMLIPVLLGVLIIVFTLNFIMPGDPVANQLPVGYTQEDYDLQQQKMGLDRPYIVQLGSYVWGVATRMDLGTSYYSNRPVKDEVSDRVWITLKIGILSCLFTVIVSIPLGILSAVKQYSALDYTVTTLTILLTSIPGFVLALGGILLFSLKLKWLPASGLSTWKHYILPVACNGLMPVAAVTRMTRSSMLEVIRQDYIRTARSKGLTEKVVILKHALKNALIPVITVIGQQFSMIIGGSIIIESIFSIPGMGMLMVNAINTRDYPEVMGITFVISAFMCVLMLIVDLVYAAADPRIKAQFAGSKRKKTETKKEGAKAA
jgi:peptide/nickel transport system permease protein